MYTDSHCHLENNRFDADRAEVFARARDAGVTTMLAIGNGDGPGTSTFDCAIKLAQQESNTAAIRTFNFALEAETEHARLYADALATLDAKKPQTKYLVCAVCGYTAEKLEGARCPVCNNPKEKFEIVN